MDTYQESQNALHVDPTASAVEIDAAYHKWHSFWTACQATCMHPDQKLLAQQEIERLDKAHRILRGRRVSVPVAQAEWFPSHISHVPGMVRGTVKPVTVVIKAAALPPPLPRRTVPPALPAFPRAQEPLDTQAAFDWRPELLIAPIPDLGFIQASKRRATRAYRHLATAVALGMGMGLMAAGLIDYLP